jgi:hypothetical protein
MTETGNKKIRFARWHTFKPKIQIWENFGGTCNGRFWYILWPFGLFYGHLVYFVADWYTYLVAIFVYFIVIWYIFSLLVCCTKKNLATVKKTRRRRIIFFSKVFFSFAA